MSRDAGWARLGASWVAELARSEGMVGILGMRSFCGPRRGGGGWADRLVAARDTGDTWGPCAQQSGLPRISSNGSAEEELSIKEKGAGEGDFRNERGGGGGQGVRSEAPG